MSRARPVRLPAKYHPLFEDDPSFRDGTYWIDVKKNGQTASNEQIELLAVIEQVDLDDLLDAVLTQGEVITRLRYALGQNGVIPTDVLERRQKWRDQRSVQPACRKCGREGDSTRHHFVPKWILKELRDYSSKWADRSKACIDLCIECHRRIHQRLDESDKSIVEFLTEEEKQFAHRALSALSEERPKLLILIARGSSETYETQLVWDWFRGEFDSEHPYARHLRAVS